MKASELILNPDGSIYHLNILPEDLAPNIILVGDPERVSKVSALFDTIDIIKQKREFITHTGWFNQKRISVISTGIGTDNIDIVINELDALVNIDLVTRLEKKELTKLNIIRVGTSGSIHPETYAGDIVVSGLAIGTDILGSYYDHQHFEDELVPDWSYITRRHSFNLAGFSLPFKEGITVTCPGFYAPQGRTIRARVAYELPIEQLQEIEIDGFTIMNLEMETSAIYLLAEVLGHKAISFNDILANRLDGKYIDTGGKNTEILIEAVVKWITSQP